MFSTFFFGELTSQLCILLDIQQAFCKAICRTQKLFLFSLLESPLKIKKKDLNRRWNVWKKLILMNIALSFVQCVGWVLKGFFSNRFLESKVTKSRKNESMIYSWGLWKYRTFNFLIFPSDCSVFASVSGVRPRKASFPFPCVGLRPRSSERLGRKGGSASQPQRPRRPAKGLRTAFGSRSQADWIVYTKEKEVRSQ